jgi:penicillin-binding protein 2
MASRGLRYRPRLLNQIGDRHLDSAKPRLVEADDENWALIHEAMKAVFHGKRGSARSSARKSAYLMAGKSGTAQVVGIAQDAEYNEAETAERHRDHGLFIAFAPYDDPVIAVAVVVENGGGGSKVAAPIARKVMDAYLVDQGERS